MECSGDERSWATISKRPPGEIVAFSTVRRRPPEREEPRVGECKSLRHSARKSSLSPSFPKEEGATGFSLVNGKSQSIEVQIMPEGESTMIRLIESSSGLAGSLMGGALGVIGAGVTPIGFLAAAALANVPGLPIGAGIASVVTLSVGSVLTGARALFGKSARKQRATVDALMTRLEAEVSTRR